ncbi:recombinase family protein [Acetobacterium sp.]|uniref:recombinase family protein n=1 Tax=Acetobacterium sp. TaxID=1872094 RepID=UPI002F3E7E88
MPKIKVVAYARFSSDNQRTESIDAQLREIKEYCLKENYQLVNVYLDEVKSGLSDERPGFLSMIDDAENNKFDAVIVHKLDRFSRDRYDSAIYKRKLKKAGVKLFSVLERLDDSPESIILESVLEGMAEYYSKNLARETLKGLTENALKCQHNGGIPALGYQVDPVTKKYVIDEYEADTVRKIYELYLNDYGYLEIVEHLNANSRQTKRGKPFGKNSLYEILKNEKYIGYYIYNKVKNRRIYGANNHNYKNAEDIIRIAGGVPQIITNEQWKKAREKMERNRRKAAQYKTKYVYPLSGLVYCERCGASYCGHHSTSRGCINFYYACSRKRNKKDCDAPLVNKELLEETVMIELEKRLFTAEGLDKTAHYIRDYAISLSMHKTSKVSSYKIELEKVNLQINKMLESIMDGMYHSSMKEKMTELEIKKSCLEKELDNYEYTESPVPSLNEIKGLIACKNVRVMNELELKECFQKYIKKVTISDGDNIQIELVVNTHGVP